MNQKPRTDSQIVEYNEDGSWTTTTVSTDFPATRAQKAQMWGMVGGLTVLSFAPLIVHVTQRWLNRKDRKAEEAAEQNKTD